MSKKRKSLIGRMLTELRRSNAAGKHGKSHKQKRAADRRKAIREQED